MYKQIIAWFVRDIWHKYHSWYFKIVSNFTRLTAREFTYNHFEIPLVVFMPNITTNHVITYTKYTEGHQKRDAALTHFCHEPSAFGVLLCWWFSQSNKCSFVYVTRLGVTVQEFCVFIWSWSRSFCWSWGWCNARGNRCCKSHSFGNSINIGHLTWLLQSKCFHFTTDNVGCIVVYCLKLSRN